MYICVRFQTLHMMKRMASYILTPIFYACFGLLLVIFHPVQVIARHLFGDKARKKTVDILNYLLVKCLHILGCRITFSGFEKIPAQRPLIIVANHQSLFDIPAVVHGFRKYYPKFISKKELSRNLPSISYNLKYGKSALIDRENGTQAVKEIFRLGRLIEDNCFSACIFPEGTRSKTGRVGKFMTGGIHTLLRAAPSAVVIPFVIDGHSQVMVEGSFPLALGQKIKYTVLDPVEPGNKDIEEMILEIQSAIRKELGQN